MKFSFMMVRPGWIDPRDLRGIANDDPCLDPRSIIHQLPEISQKLRGKTLKGVFIAENQRSRDMVEGLKTLDGLDRNEIAIELNLLNVKARFDPRHPHMEGVAPPLLPFIGDSEQIVDLVGSIAKEGDLFLVIASGVRMLAMRAHAEGQQFDDDRQFIVDWGVPRFPDAHEPWNFTVNFDPNKATEIEWKVLD